MEKREKKVSSSLLKNYVGRTVIAEFENLAMEEDIRKRKKKLASLRKSIESVFQATASVDSRTCLGKALKAFCEKLMDESNLLHNSLGVLPVAEITLVEYIFFNRMIFILGVRLC